MMNKSLVTLVGGLSLASISQGDNAPPNFPQLSYFVRDQVKHTFAALNTTAGTAGDPRTTVHTIGWQFTRFYIETYATTGFHIPFLVNLEVYPEIDLIWEKTGFAQ